MAAIFVFRNFGNFPMFDCITLSVYFCWIFVLSRPLNFLCIQCWLFLLLFRVVCRKLKIDLKKSIQSLRCWSLERCLFYDACHKKIITLFSHVDPLERRFKLGTWLSQPSTPNRNEICLCSYVAPAVINVALNVSVVNIFVTQWKWFGVSASNKIHQILQKRRNGHWHSFQRSNI